MKILLFGSTGLLGSAFTEVLSGEEVYSYSKKECDITDAIGVSAIVRERHPDIVINTTGWTNVEGAEEEPEKAFAVNAYAVGRLATICESEKIPLVHFSTDYVFDGSREGGYVESDSPAPINLYGASKAAGETLLQKETGCFFLIRTSWLFGPHGKNFVSTILKKAKEQPNISVVNDQFGKPTYSRDLAIATLALMKSQKYGIYHIVNEGVVSWFDFAIEIVRTAEIDSKVLPMKSADLHQKARRPRISALMNTKLAKLRSWKEALHDNLLTL
ncbi:MAG: dTDP-4-dehydrorhamnose reductase [Candidatus Peregrinibacteria bacterium GW2011_GWA2_47_7]|nr:MAG: dTDP-4-dehydrorhamnose reductase [Candidatus Peregrinibacteria bacterium GW2011_GWA2_47_7]